MQFERIVLPFVLFRADADGENRRKGNGDGAGEPFDPFVTIPLMEKSIQPGGKTARQRRLRQPGIAVEHRGKFPGVRSEEFTCAGKFQRVTTAQPAGGETLKYLRSGQSHRKILRNWSGQLQISDVIERHDDDQRPPGSRFEKIERTTEHPVNSRITPAVSLTAAALAGREQSATRNIPFFPGSNRSAVSM